MSIILRKWIATKMREATFSLNYILSQIDPNRPAGFNKWKRMNDGN